MCIHDPLPQKNNKNNDNNNNNNDNNNDNNNNDNNNNNNNNNNNTHQRRQQGRLHHLVSPSQRGEQLVQRPLEQAGRRGDGDGA